METDEKNTHVWRRSRDERDKRRDVYDERDTSGSIEIKTWIPRQRLMER